MMSDITARCMLVARASTVAACSYSRQNAAHRCALQTVTCNLCAALQVSSLSLPCNDTV